MNEEAQRIAIAEACGWKPTGEYFEDDWVWMSKGFERVKQRMLPDYLHDLNAMHEAAMVLEHSMSKLDYTAYLDELVGLVCANPAHPSGYATAVDATATQRAEAFLRTLGLWTEDTHPTGEEETA